MWQFLSEALMVHSKSHMFSYFLFFYVFGIPVSFSSLLLGYFVCFCPKLVETKTNLGNAKPVQFRDRTRDKICFVPLVYFFSL
jgi:hypothetical protein